MACVYPPVWHACWVQCIDRSRRNVTLFSGRSSSAAQDRFQQVRRGDHGDLEGTVSGQGSTVVGGAENQGFLPRNGSTALYGAEHLGTIPGL